MLDHVFTDAIGALRETLEGLFLERQKDVDERFTIDVNLGDLRWESSYGLPGEGMPPRIAAVLVLEWSTWSQTAYRNWLGQVDLDELPKIDIEIGMRIQRLAIQVDPRLVLDVLPDRSPAIGLSDPLERLGPTLETLFGETLDDPAYAIEVGYEGTYELTEGPLADGSILDQHFAALGGWIASTLVRLGDLKLDYLPPEEEEVNP